MATPKEITDLAHRVIDNPQEFSTHDSLTKALERIQPYATENTDVRTERQVYFFDAGSHLDQVCVLYMHFDARANHRISAYQVASPGIRMRESKTVPLSFIDQVSNLATGLPLIAISKDVTLTLEESASHEYHSLLGLTYDGCTKGGKLDDVVGGFYIIKNALVHFEKKNDRRAKFEEKEQVLVTTVGGARDGDHIYTIEVKYLNGKVEVLNKGPDTALLFFGKKKKPES